MRIEVLISTMKRDNYNFLKSMNLKTDCIVGNQNNCNKEEILQLENHIVKCYTSSEKGLSRNRNLTLKYASADICLISDDDLEYVDNYVEIVNNAFEKYHYADIIIFNIYENPITRYIIKKPFKVSWYNYLRFGSVRIAFKRESIIKNKILFDENYGSGAKIPMGEDNIFLHDCLKKKLTIVAVPDYILRLTNERDSTWFKGYDDIYFKNKGQLYRRIYPKIWKIICLQDVIRHKKMFKINGSFIKNYKIMISK